MKSQISTEYLLILGLIFIFIIPLFYYSMQEASLSIRINQASDAVVTIAKTADSLYALGNGSKDKLILNLPKGINSFQISNKEIIMKLNHKNATSDIIAISRVPVTCTYATQPTCNQYTLPITEGINEVQVECCTLINNVFFVKIGG